MVFVVAGAPWQKKGYADAEDRYLMAVAATGSDPRFVVSRVEIDRHGPTYTVDTLELLRDFYGASAELYLIVGADAAADLHTWHRADALGSLAVVAVVTRPGVDPARLKDAREAPGVVIIDEAEVDVSATEVRRAVAAGHLPAASLPAAVGAYILRKGLYGR